MFFKVCNIKFLLYDRQSSLLWHDQDNDDAVMMMIMMIMMKTAATMMMMMTMMKTTATMMMMMMMIMMMMITCSQLLSNPFTNVTFLLSDWYFTQKLLRNKLAWICVTQQ